MGVLTVDLTPDIFAKIPEFSEALAKFQKSNVYELLGKSGHVFAKHKVHEKFGLCMIHRHFGMDSDQILVEVMRKDQKLSVATAWKLQGSSGVPTDMSLLSSYGISGEKKLVSPQTYCFSDNGELVPFEFVATDEEVPLPRGEFGKDLYAFLKELGLEKILGVRSTAFTRGKGSSWESTPAGLRANVITFGVKPEEEEGVEMVEVLWTFNEEGTIGNDIGRCKGHIYGCHHCTHYCRLHWTKLQ